jgi:uncharacterized protein
MSLQSFPEIIDVRKFFSQEAHLKASLPLEVCKRLEPYLSKAEGFGKSKIDVNLAFIKDDQGHYILDGKIESTLFLPCQRCLRGLEHSLSSEFSVQVLDELKVSGDRELAENELEVVLSHEGNLELLALVEDELILSLPLVIYHDKTDCNPKLVSIQESGRKTLESKPFAELELLKEQLLSGKGKTD